MKAADWEMIRLAVTSTTSLYAACATSNIVQFSFVSGIGVSNVNDALNLGADNGVYQCCVSCVTDPSRASAEYQSDFGCWTVEVSSGSCGNPLCFLDEEGANFPVMGGCGQFVT